MKMSNEVYEREMSRWDRLMERFASIGACWDCGAAVGARRFLTTGFMLCRDCNPTEHRRPEMDHAVPA